MAQLTISFTTKPAAVKAYNHLRNCSILAKTAYNYKRGDHRLHILIPPASSADQIQTGLKASGFRYYYMGVDP